jgi:hypothetical protein
MLSSSQSGEAAPGVLVDYWVAARVGRWWQRVARPRLRGPIGYLSGECDLIARGASLPAGRLWRAQDFAARDWTRLMLSLAILAFPVSGIMFALLRGAAQTVVVVVVIGAGGLLAALAGLQVGMVWYRSARTRLYLREAGPDARDEPLGQDEPGLPRRYDFWVTLAAGVAAEAILGVMKFH